MLSLLRIYASVLYLVWLLFSVSLFPPTLIAISSPPTPSTLQRYCIDDVAWVRCSHHLPCYGSHSGARRSFCTDLRSEFQALLHHRFSFPVMKSTVYHLSLDAGEAYVSQQQTQWSIHSLMLPFEVAGPLLQILLINYGTCSTSIASLVVSGESHFLPETKSRCDHWLHDRFDPKPLLRLVYDPQCVSMIGLDLLQTSCLPFITRLRCSDVANHAPMNSISLRIIIGSSLEGSSGINPKVLQFPLVDHIGLLSLCWVQSLQRSPGGIYSNPLGQLNWPPYCLHPNLVQASTFSSEAQSRNECLLNHLERQSWYVLILLSPLASFGSGPKQKIDKMVVDILSSPIRSVGILIGAPYSSLPFSDRCSIERNLIQGVLESQPSSRVNCIRVLVVTVGSLIRSIGILIGIHQDPSPLSLQPDSYIVMAGNPYLPQAFLNSGMGFSNPLFAYYYSRVVDWVVILIRWPYSYAYIQLSLVNPMDHSRVDCSYVTTMTSLPISHSLVSESPKGSHQRRSTPCPELVPTSSTARLPSKEISTAQKRANYRLLKAAQFWSPFGKCAFIRINHLDPIEELVSMQSEELSFYPSFTNVILVFCFCFISCLDANEAVYELL